MAERHTSTDFRTTLTAAGTRPSMGRVGSCYDNAAAESFFATLKAEIRSRVWASRDQASRAVFAPPELLHHERLRSTLGYRTPHEARVRYRQLHARAA